MEQKLVRVPFDIELAKKITNKEIEGRIVTRNGMSARIICWDADRKDCIIALLSTISDGECLLTYKPDGRVNVGFEKNANLILEIPEYMTFKDGDVLSYEGGTFILKKIDGKDRAEYYFSSYGKYTAFDSACLMKNLVNHLRLVAEEEKQKLIDALKASKDPRAKEYLKRFFGVEEKKEYHFEPKDWVLCKNVEWCLCRFSHKTVRFDGVLMYVTVGGIAFDKCIPYNEQTAHLLGTTDDWER